MEIQVGFIRNFVVSKFRHAIRDRIREVFKCYADI